MSGVREGKSVADSTADSSRGRFASLTNTDDVELESALQELALDLGGDAVETDMALGVDGGSRYGRHCGQEAKLWTPIEMSYEAGIEWMEAEETATGLDRTWAKGQGRGRRGMRRTSDGFRMS